MPEETANPKTPTAKPKRFPWVLVCALLSLGFVFWFGASTGGHGTSRTAKARAQKSALMLAIKQYETQYGKLPAQDGLVQDYGRLIFALTDQSPENPHKIPFLVPSKIHAVTGRPELKDPWGNNFVIILNSSGTIQAGTGGIYETINSNVAVWSIGPNRIDDHGENDGKTKDDINSWR